MKTGFALGLMAGVGILSKYYAVLLMLSCFLATLVHRDRLPYFRSPAPWVALLVLGAVATPHFIWVVQHNYQPFLYAAKQSAHPKAKFAYTWFGFLLACALYHLLQLGVILAVGLKQNEEGKSSPTPHIQHGLAFLSVLALTPLALTFSSGLAATA